MAVKCAIAGGGPAGLMLGYLLARAGVDVAVFEKHADFLRDFRGDTIHPSTLEVMYELGLLDRFLQRPHQKIRELGGQIGNTHVKIVDFTHVPTHCKYLVLMPQWDFLDFIAAEAGRFPTFALEREAEVRDVVEEQGRIVGVRLKTRTGEKEVRADLVIGADGRSSIVRERAGLIVEEIGAPIDVLWFRLSRKPGDPAQTFGRIEAGAFLVMLDRDDYWQCAYVIPKGGAETVRARGLDAFREQLAMLQPFLRDRVDELRDWNDAKLLTVKIDRLKEWARDGLLCIGDAAHAMSPVGGVGINLAIQDAVAAANLLAAPLARGTCSLDDLRRVQQRRQWPTIATQSVQVFAQKRVIFPTLSRMAPVKVPWAMQLLNRFAVLRRIPARILAVGFRPEHVSRAVVRPDTESPLPAAR
jgi:2-polyprenyl-6-methoxyphenol hydroxylase-like FAD-dependent oxidoreductase